MSRRYNNWGRHQLRPVTPILRSASSTSVHDNRVLSRVRKTVRFSSKIVSSTRILPPENPNTKSLNFYSEEEILRLQLECHIDYIIEQCNLRKWRKLYKQLRGGDMHPTMTTLKDDMKPSTPSTIDSDSLSTFSDDRFSRDQSRWFVEGKPVTESSTRLLIKPLEPFPYEEYEEDGESEISYVSENHSHKSKTLIQNENGNTILIKPTATNKNESSPRGRYGRLRNRVANAVGNFLSSSSRSLSSNSTVSTSTSSSSSIYHEKSVHNRQLARFSPRSTLDIS